ncbi:MAG: Dabb family protein [Clostridia bacterium]|nr:Dabb family protein [Clostridia bacterium]MBR4973644.1 Dabb family protein [Clostridia bacterium]
MVKHIILWKLKEVHNNQDVKNGIKQALEGLLGKIPGLLEINVQTKTLESSNVDVMLYSVFESQEALKGYAVHPEHVKVADTFVRPFTETRSCIDFCDEL